MFPMTMMQHQLQRSKQEMALAPKVFVTGGNSHAIDGDTSYVGSSSEQASQDVYKKRLQIQQQQREPSGLEAPDLVGLSADGTVSVRTGIPSNPLTLVGASLVQTRVAEDEASATFFTTGSAARPYSDFVATGAALADRNDVVEGDGDGEDMPMDTNDDFMSPYFSSQ